MNSMITYATILLYLLYFQVFIDWTSEHISNLSAKICNIQTTGKVVRGRRGGGAFMVSEFTILRVYFSLLSTICTSSHSISIIYLDDCQGALNLQAMITLALRIMKTYFNEMVKVDYYHVLYSRH